MGEIFSVQNLIRCGIFLKKAEIRKHHQKQSIDIPHIDARRRQKRVPPTMAFARGVLLLPSSVTTRTSKNDGRRQNRATRKAAVFSASLSRDENDDEPIITTIAGKAVAAVVATAVALSAPTRASAEEVVRFCNYPVLWFCSRARTRELFPVRAFSWRGKSLG